MRGADPDGRELILDLYIDGASKGNPGDAGAGLCVKDADGKKVFEMSRYLGRRTNNEAEYWALLFGLREARRLGATSVRIFTDSELVERQVKGVYRVKNPNLKVLHASVIEQLGLFRSYVIEAIPRERNGEADRLANQAVQNAVAGKRGKGGIEEEPMAAPHRFP